MTHSKTKCMDCKSPPTKEVKWAEGIAHAWFCDEHFKAWAKANPDELELVRALDAGHVGERYGDAPGHKTAAAGATGEYQGKPSSPDSVKKTITYGGLTIKLDRPKGFIMRGTAKDGKQWERVYQYDYGFIPNTEGGDGDGVDVFIGPLADDQEAYWARQVKDDGMFDEYKVFLGFGSVRAAERAFKDHIPAKYFDGISTMKIGLMKAMLGLAPAEKVATRLAFFDELHRLGAL